MSPEESGTNRDQGLGTALICHGLNLQPERMGVLSAVLADQGLEIGNLVLKGHGPHDSLEDFCQVSTEIWKDQGVSAWQELCAAPGPLITLGYSLGALCSLAALAEIWRTTPERYREPDGHIFIAPALATRAWTRSVKWAAPWPKLIIPSMSPATYRRHRGTPVAAYLALKGLLEALAHACAAGFRLANPVLVILNPRDELVDPNKTCERLDILTHGRYEILRIDHSSAKIRPAFAHLALDAATLGDFQFQSVVTKIQSFTHGVLRPSPPTPLGGEDV